MAVEKVMVIGAGQMGAGIAQVFAQSGFQVKLNDIAEENLQKGLATIEKHLSRNVEKGRMDEADKTNTLNNLETTTSLNDANDCDLVIEAVVENMDVKTKVFQQLDQITPKHAILASNTSSLPITDIAAVTERPEQVIGMHFMNPVPVMKLVEVIRAIQTTDETYQTIAETAEKLNKTAVYTVFEGVAEPEAIDEVMKLGMNHPMGPLRLADFIGLDTCLSIMEILHEGFGDSKYRPCPLLRKYVNAGWLGKKSGRGFYVYE